MLSVSCFAVAQTLHGSGFIAVFVGGLLFGYLARRSTHDLVLDTEGFGETLGMLTWALFGAVVIPGVVKFINWQVIVYAPLSLTVIRMLPIVLSLVGTKEPIHSKLFLAWFGPRGLASIVFAVIVINNNLPGAELISVIVAYTINFSAFTHGLTANPLASVLAARLNKF